jgi:ubiquinone/menaquinone biosynthesis C-methylase UbiE
MPPALLAMPRIDYDNIAGLYDEPSRDHTVDSNLLAFLEEPGTTGGVGVRIIDIGCGTGKQLAADQVEFPGAHLVGIDRFSAMVRIGQKRCPSAAWVQGDGAALPLVSGTVDYATSHFSYLHVRRTPELLLDVFRVLKAGGRFVMTNIDPRAMPRWMVYRFFPEAQELDHRDFIPTERFVALMGDIGFEHVRVSHTELSRDEQLDEFLTFVSGRHRASQLLAISDAAYYRGVQRVRETVATADVPQVERSQFVLVTILGDKPRVHRAA